jgi:hypothetical protein
MYIQIRILLLFLKKIFFSGYFLIACLTADRDLQDESLYRSLSWQFSPAQITAAKMGPIIHSSSVIPTQEGTGHAKDGNTHSALQQFPPASG